MPLVTHSITLPVDLSESLRRFAYVNRTTKSQIIRDALNFYFKTPEEQQKERDKCK